MTHDHEIVPLERVKSDIRQMEKMSRELRDIVYPHLKGQLPWRFAPFWILLWGGLIMQGAKYPFVMGFFTMWSALYFFKHCAIALGCRAHIKEVDERVIGLTEYMNEHYPNEKE